MALRRKESEFYVYVVSSSINDGFDNTTTEFANKLQNESLLPANENWVVGLSCLYVANLFAGDTAKELDTRFVKVESSIILPKYDSTSSTLAICARPTPNIANKGENRCIYFEPRNREYFPLRSPVLTDIDIALTDRKGRRLKLQFGQPTLVVLHFKRMPTKEYIVRVDSSNDPDATADEFKANLPAMMSIDPQKQWHVCLHSCIYNGQFEQILPYTSPASSICKIFAWDRQDMMEEDDEANGIAYKFTFPRKEYDNNYQLFEFFQLELAKCKDERKTKPISVFELILKGPDEMVTFDCKYFLKIEIPYIWAAMLGCTRPPNRHGWVVYSGIVGKTISFEQPMNVHMWTPNYMLLYTNCIDYTNIGSEYAVPVLKAIPLVQSRNYDKHMYQHYEPISEEYHRVSYSQLSDCRFWLKQVDGRPVGFTNKKQRIILSLKFIQK